MFASERIKIIKSYIRENKRLDVHSISGLLDVSEVTIRRDLEKLESEGFLTRVHGGAILSEEEDGLKTALPPGEDREREDREEIARIASLMIGDGDVVLILNGPTSFHLARRLAERGNLTVLTNDIAVALEVGSQTSNKSVLVGGNLDMEHRALFGSLALSNLQKFCVSKLFWEADGMSENLQLTVSSQEKADLVREACLTADQRIILCPAGNFSRNAFFRLGTLSRNDTVITNTRIPDRIKSAMFAAEIRLFTSVSAFEGGDSNA